MKRLTVKLPASNGTYEGQWLNDIKEMAPVIGTSHAKQIYTKLSELEDSEENIGMELTTIINALKNGIYVRNSQGIRGYQGCASCYLSFGYDMVMKSFYFTMKVKGVQQYFIKDYGKTWALTQEELK